MNVLYSLHHIGYTIPPQADAGWIGEAGPGLSYLGRDRAVRLNESQLGLHELESRAFGSHAEASGGSSGSRQSAVSVGVGRTLRLGEPRVPSMTSRSPLANISACSTRPNCLVDSPELRVPMSTWTAKVQIWRKAPSLCARHVPNHRAAIHRER